MNRIEEIVIGIAGYGSVFWHDYLINGGFTWRAVGWVTVFSLILWLMKIRLDRKVRELEINSLINILHTAERSSRHV